MTNEEFIQEHRKDDIRKLAFAAVPAGVDLKWCLEQIEGWQIAVRKLPHWATDEGGHPIEGLWYPPKLSMEQCSSEETARYKAEIVKRLMPDACLRAKMVDLTGGYGVDFSYIAPLFKHATYVEKQTNLCEIAQHNFPLLGLPEAEIVCADNIGHLAIRSNGGLLVYLDPARRDDVGRKTVAIEDCTPNVVGFQHEMLKMADLVMIKLSPMLDISDALRKLNGVREIHVVSVKGECKELLVCLTSQPISEERGTDPDVNKRGKISVTCVNLGTEDKPFTVDVIPPSPLGGCLERMSDIAQYLYEPNASILKAGVQDWLAERMPVKKLHPMSNLFTSDELVYDFPGRKFRVTQTYNFSKKSLKALAADLRKADTTGEVKANIAIRNFPGTVEALRKRLKLKEGGSEYLFATTAHDGTHCLVRCSKCNKV